MFHYILQAVFLGYLVLTGYFLREGMVVFFKFKRNWRSFVLGAFLSFTFTGSMCGAVIVFFKLTYLTLGLIGLFGLLIFGLLYLWARKSFVPDLPESALAKDVPKNEAILVESKITWLQIVFIAVYGILAAVGFYFLYTSKSGSSVTTPWQVINKNYIYVFAAATATLFLLLYLRLRSSVLLVLIIVNTLLLTSYLPLTHELIYGGDAWRHIATEERILSGKDVLDPLVTDKKEIMSLSFLVGKLAYSQVWGISVMLAKLGFDLVTVNKWLLPIAWSLIFPILLFKIGMALRLGPRFSLLFALFGFLPFAWQAGGSFTLPANYGFLVWLTSLLFIFKRGNNPEPEQKYILFLAGALVTFGYSLYVLLFWVGWFVFEVIRSKGDFTYFEIALIVLGVSAILPVCEWFFGYSSLIPSGSFVEGFKQFFGNFTAYYLATGPRPHDISTGNVIFNQVPAYAYVVNLFTAHLWLMVVFMAGFWVAVAYGLWVSFYKGFGSISVVPGNYDERIERTNVCWAMSFSIGLYLSYIVSRYWLSGEHLLTRRLDSVLAFLFVTLAVLGLSHIPKKFRPYPIYIFGAIFLVFGISASYSLGPDTNVTSVDEYAAMRYIWQEEKERDKHCVIAKVYPLLSLEAISEKAIIGGGFPIDSNFGQTELSNILMNAKNSSVSILDVYKAQDVTGSNRCWIVTQNGESISFFIKQKAIQKNIGSVNLWEYER